MHHNIIDRVWAKVGVDLLHVEGRDYLIAVDYLMNYWEVENFNNAAALASGVYRLKQQFA